MFDLHCHILPGVDDGSSDLRCSLEMAALAAESGVKGIAATPHYGFSPDMPTPGAFLRAFDELERAMAAYGISLPLYRGMELFASDGLTELLRSRRVLTLNASRYLLTEFDFGAPEEVMDGMLAQIADAGYIPVIAHPERYDAMQDDPELAFRWCEEGWKLQLNKGSFFGYFGAKAADTAHRLLFTGTVHLIASDAHGPYQRTPRLNDIYDYVSDICFPALADLLLTDNPRMILNDGDPAAAQIIFPINGDEL